MPDPEQTVRGSIEIDGKVWIVWRRGSQSSFDGETFHDRAIDAYLGAKRAKKLVSAEAGAEVKDLPQDAAVAILQIVRLIRSLRPGEELRVIHAGGALSVVRAKNVAAFMPSVFDETGLEPSEDDEEG